jgi:hypothetical protein
VASDHVERVHDAGLPAEVGGRRAGVAAEEGSMGHGADSIQPLAGCRAEQSPTAVALPPGTTSSSRPVSRTKLVAMVVERRALARRERHVMDAQLAHAGRVLAVLHERPPVVS